MLMSLVRLQDTSASIMLVTAPPRSFWVVRTAQDGNEDIVPWAKMYGTEARSKNRRARSLFMLSLLGLAQEICARGVETLI